ncbi:MAG: tRNA (adenosine(37)-N6)-threonylcarbamoyltransferase complex dimerization subunit type 1 TsaB [Actinobacteria bacterium]|nr:tRNA (adenosine(37)-N6)-threonylcarbamoyltransferase complex dimerization subunit type 1 TsaB [Actinomycetota bacterium]
MQPASVLAIETATDQASVALSHNGELRLRDGGEAQRHTEQVAPAIRDLLAEAGIRPQAIDLVAVDHGPGLFTGLRVGLATAISFAAALELPIAAVTSTDLLAEAAREIGFTGILTCAVDARRGEVFAATYEISTSDIIPILAPHCLDPKGLEGLLLNSASQAVAGDGAARYRDALHGVALLEAVLVPSAATLVRVALRMLEQGECKDSSAVQARYLREPDAVANFTVRGQR